MPRRKAGANDVFAKIWLADGTQAEPAAWQSTYDYTPTRSTRTGFAGIAASSAAGTAEFDVDYVLIKAAGLPNITVAPRAFVQTPVAITNQPQSITSRQCKSVTFTVGASGNPPPTFQWSKDGGGGFSAISGATNSSLTVTNVRLADNGSQYPRHRPERGEQHHLLGDERGGGVEHQFWTRFSRCSRECRRSACRRCR